MPIDPRSNLGQNLEVREPVQVDLGQLDSAAGEEILRRMEKGKSREEALVGFLNFASKLMADGVVSIDTSVVSSAHPEVPRAIEKIQDAAEASGKPLTVGRTITKLVVVGSRTIIQPPKPKQREGRTRNSLSDLFEGILTDDIFGRSNR